MQETDVTLPDGRRLLQTKDFSKALAALNENPEARVAVTVEFERVVGTSGHSGEEFTRDELTLFRSWSVPNNEWKPASRFIDAAIDHRGDLAAAVVGLVMGSVNSVQEAEEFDSEYHVHTAEGPTGIRINWSKPEPI